MMSNFYELKNLVSEMNELNDQISFFKFNNDEGVKFDSVEEMKEFILQVESGNLDFVFNGIDIEGKIPQKELIESFNYTKKDIYFFIYTYENNNKYITYLSIKRINDNYVIDNLCGKESKDMESAHNWFEELKYNILNTGLNELIETLIVGAKNTIKRLKIEMQELASVG